MKTRLLALAFVTAPVFAAPPPVVNGSTQPIASLASAPSSGWVGYVMPTARPLNVTCCDGWSNCNRCRLDSDNLSINRRDPDEIGPAGDSQLLLFAHLRDGAVERLRVYSPHCTIDAAGQTIHWAEGVTEQASIRFLRTAAEQGAKRGRDGALLALSMHAGTAAVDTLIVIARNNADRETRGKALFWLSQQAGRKAADALRDAVENDPEDEVRTKAVFGISQLPNDQSIPMLVDLLKHHRSREVRKKAAFWLGQKNDPRALAAIEDILTK